MALHYAGSARVICDKDVVSCELESGMAMLDLRSSVYYDLGPVGAVIWQQAQQASSVDQINAAVIDRFDVAPDVCATDVDALLQQLVAAGMVTVDTADAG